MRRGERARGRGKVVRGRDEKERERERSTVETGEKKRRNDVRE